MLSRAKPLCHGNAAEFPCCEMTLFTAARLRLAQACSLLSADQRPQPGSRRRFRDLQWRVLVTVCGRADRAQAFVRSSKANDGMPTEK